MVAENAAVLNRMRKAGIETVSPFMGMTVLSGAVSRLYAVSQVTISS